MFIIIVIAAGYVGCIYILIICLYIILYRYLYIYNHSSITGECRAFLYRTKEWKSFCFFFALPGSTANCHIDVKSVGKTSFFTCSVYIHYTYIYVWLFLRVNQSYGA